MNTRLSSKIGKIKALGKGNYYKGSWNSIIEQIKHHQFTYDDIQDDFYFEDIPFLQEMLTSLEFITKEKLDYSNYTHLSNFLFNRYNVYECFHGILFYIYYYSKNKFNIEEIEIHFSGAKNLNYSSNNQNNILNIFDYENINSEFKINCFRNAFFGVTFKNIKIQPAAFAIRSGIYSQQSSHLVSFTFEGFDEENQKWDVLNEQANINDLIQSGGFMIFYVRSSSKCYSSFKIKQTSPSSNDIWGFSLAAFEIHGIIYYKNEINSNIIWEKNNEFKCTKNVFENIDPSLDMSEYLI